MPIIGPDGKPVITARKMFPALFTLNGAEVVLHADGRVTGDLEGMLEAFANCGPGDALPVFWLMAAEIRRQMQEADARDKSSDMNDLLASISAGHELEQSIASIANHSGPVANTLTESGQLYPEDSFDFLDPKHL
jgi:hypothetical protein